VSEAVSAEVGGRVDLDGAKMNAIVGKTRRVLLGADIEDDNVHRRFSTPRGYGGRGGGPIVERDFLGPY